MRRKGQEEIVGFVLVVVLVVIVLIVFLGISLRKPVESQQESEIVYQFLESSMEQTTECSIGNRQDLLKLDDLIRECYSANSECSDGIKSCVKLNKTWDSILSASWSYGEDYQLKGFYLDITYGVNSTGQGVNEQILNIAEGNCSGSIYGNSYWTPEFPGSITSTLKLCY